MDPLIVQKYTDEAVDLLIKLIETPSFSKEEKHTADIIEQFFKLNHIPTERIGNNVIARQAIHSSKPVFVLNSHHDTVKPTEGWTFDPFKALVQNGKITGLGSNDAGASLVSLIVTFVHYYEMELPYQLMLICSAEEEISGKDGVEKVLHELSLVPNCAIVGEPTQCQMAVAEKGLMVVDGIASGISGHAAHQMGNNAIYNALTDIKALSELKFSKISENLGPVKITVTQINAGQQHNVIPDTCHFVIDCRINEHYTHEDCLAKLRSVCSSKLTPRSMRLKSSSISTDHPLVLSGLKLGLSYYGSPTLSDQVFFSCPSLKIGPGDSSRSHQADEYININEIKEGIQTYIQLLEKLIV